MSFQEDQEKAKKAYNDALEAYVEALDIAAEIEKNAIDAAEKVYEDAREKAASIYDAAGEVYTSFFEYMKNLNGSEVNFYNEEEFIRGRVKGKRE